jgi:hypothetical protein
MKIILSMRNFFLLMLICLILVHGSLSGIIQTERTEGKLSDSKEGVKGWCAI